MSLNAPPGLPYFILAVIAFFGGRGLWSWAKARSHARAAESWPTVEARVEGFYLIHNAGARGSVHYLSILQYAYAVREERYSGSFNLGVWSGTEDSASVTGQGWIGEKIQVRYKPSDPAVSIWLEQDGAPAGSNSSVPYGDDESVIDPQLNK